MRGMRSFIKTNVMDAGNAAIDGDMINDLVLKLYETGAFVDGSKHVIMLPAIQKQGFSQIFADRIRYDRSETVRGQVVEKFETDFGTFPVILNDNLKSDELFLVDLNRVKIRPLKGREFQHEYLGRAGDYRAGQIVGEYTLEFKQEKAHARIKGLRK